MLELKNLKRRANVVQKESAIATLMTRRDLGEPSRLEFLQRVSFKFLSVPAKRKKTWFSNILISPYLKHDTRISPYS